MNFIFDKLGRELITEGEGLMVESEKRPPTSPFSPNFVLNPALAFFYSLSCTSFAYK